MKVCPQCNNRYTDASLNFCLQDGRRLSGEIGESDSQSMNSFAETETIISNKRPREISFELGNKQNHNVADSHVKTVPTSHREQRSSKTLLAVFLTIISMLLIFGLVGIGAYFYLNSGKETVVANETSNLEVARDKNVNVTSPPNPEVTKKDVSDAIYSWKSSAESRNLRAYMGKYASRIDYYRKKNASKSFVKKDKNRAFSKYESIKSEFSNMNIKPSVDGRKALVEFDKEWVLKSVDSENSGKVRSQLKLEKFGENWLITSEKDLKIYYVNK